MLRKFIVCTILMSFLLTSLVSAQSFQELTVLDKTASAERVIYGNAQTGSLIERADKLERDLFGETTSSALTARLDAVYSYLAENSPTAPSFQSKINAVEWTINHNVTAQPAKTKIENIELTLLGNSEVGNLDDRVDKLAQIAYPGGKINVSSTTVYQDTLVKIKTVTELDSRKNRVGDLVVYQTAEDVYSNGLLVIPQGTQGTGKITKVRQSRNFGRDAVLEVSFDNITAFDNTLIQTEMGDKAKEETKSLVKAAGASVAGIALLGPIGVVGGAFIRGSDITIPAGTELYIQIKADTTVYGLQTD